MHLHDVINTLNRKFGHVKYEFVSTYGMRVYIGARHYGISVSAVATGPLCVLEIDSKGPVNNSPFADHLRGVLLGRVRDADGNLVDTI